MTSFTDNAEKARKIIEDIVLSSGENALKGPFNDEPAWDRPVVGFCRGDDEIFETFKEVVSDYHWSPLEIFRKTFPDNEVEPKDLSVISWILPQTSKTKDDNARENRLPAERWVRSRIFGEIFNDLVRKETVKALTDLGYSAVAPVISEGWSRVDSKKYVFASKWSERHIAHACGLGTFGLCDGLITPVGKAVRFGSVVVNMKLPKAHRDFETYYDDCPFLKDGKCGVCIERCPAGAITEKGHNKRLCKDYINNVVNPYVKEVWGLEEGEIGCGLCQTGVPCESQIPGRPYNK